MIFLIFSFHLFNPNVVWSSKNYFRPCCARKAALSLDFPTPRLTSHFYRQILSHVMVGIVARTLFSSLLLFWKTFLFRLSMLLHMSIGMLNQLIEYWGLPVRLDLIRTSLTALNRTRAFHPFSFCSNLCLISSKSVCFFFDQYSDSPNTTSVGAIWEFS